MKILCIGDAHFRESLGYADYVKDRRVEEKKEILNFIVEAAKPCDTVVFLGDQLNSRNNSSEVIREFVEFVERFDDKEVYVIAGNHEKKGDGKSAIDFMREVNKKNWHIITNDLPTIKINQRMFTFCPYFSKSELGVETDIEGTEKLLKQMPGGDVVFAHHAISDTMTTSGTQTNIFEEIIFSKTELESRYKLVVGGHIHKPQEVGRTIVAGSVFNNEVGEDGKSVWILDVPNDSILAIKTQEIKLPGRGIHKLENPTDKQLEDIDKKDIVKVVLTEKKEVEDVAKLKEKLEKFEAYVLLEQYPHERTKVHFEEGMLDFDIEKLLEVYSKQKNVPLEKLKLAWNLIK